MATLRFVDRVNEGSIHAEEITRVYKKRWLMLVIFVLCAMANSSHWLQYTITSQSVAKFYGISLMEVDMTAMVYSITFVFFVFPAIWCIEKAGLKWMLIFGDSLMIAGSLMKLVSANPGLFYVGFAGQILLGTSQVFIVNVPSFLAAMWFPPKEVSTACAVGVLGTQIGIMIGYTVPPLLITKSDDTKQLQIGFFWVYIILSVLPIVLFPILIFVFANRPFRPPSLAEFSRMSTARKHEIFPALRSLLENYNFIMVNISYSLNVSVFYCMSTLIDQMVFIHFNDADHLSGILGVIMISFGVFGCLLCGWLLDRIHKFKLLALTNYCLSSFSLGIFWVGLHFTNQFLMMFACIGMGIFLASYVIVAIEFSSELTYPVRETITTSILLAFGELMSVVLIFCSAALLQAFGDLAILYIFAGFMLVGLLATALISKPELLRRKASGGIHLHKPRKKNKSVAKNEQSPSPGEAGNEQATAAPKVVGNARSTVPKAVGNEQTTAL